MSQQALHFAVQAVVSYSQDAGLYVRDDVGGSALTRLDTTLIFEAFTHHGADRLVGISAPATYRVATERNVFAMPEAGIGLFPDVGGGWFLPRLVGETGLWLALTGARLKAADCLLLGLATDYVPQDQNRGLEGEAAR